MKIVLASTNLKKIDELHHYLKDLKIEIIPQSHFNISEAEETGLSFVENAIIKARHAAKYTGLPAIADDSGIVVDALKGEPGIYSARYAGTKASDQQNIEKLLNVLKDVPEKDRTARFQCVIVYMQHELDPTPLICEGTWEGSILFSTQGAKGFGYDPIFYVPTNHCSAAELTLEEKNNISHRGKALEKLYARLKNHL